MAEYPARKTYRGKGPFEKEAIKAGHPPVLDFHQRVEVRYTKEIGKVDGYDLRIVDPPIWHYHVNGKWYDASELKPLKETPRGR